MKKILLLSLVCVSVIITLTGCGRSTPEENLVSAIRAAETGDWKNARKYADRAAAGAPDHVGALVMRAIACDKSGDFDQALDSARRAANLDPENFAAVYTLGRLYSLDPLRCAEAVNTLVAALKLKPESADAKILICNVLSKMSSPAALRYLLILQKDERFANDPGLHSQMAVIYAKLGKNSIALQSFLKAYKADSDNIDVIFNTARFCEFYVKNSRVARQFYARFESKASGKEAYTAELDEARGALKN